MHVAVIIDEERLLREHAMLNRLCIGLMDEGMQLTRIVPEEAPPEPVALAEQRLGLAARLAIPLRVMPWMRRQRIARLAGALGRTPPDVVYAVGAGAWPVGLDLAQALERPLALDVWSADMARRVPRRGRARRVGGYIVPTGAIGDALRSRVGEDLVSVVPMGVALPKSHEPVLRDPAASVSLALLGSGRDAASHSAALEGLKRVAEQHPQVQAVLELRGPKQHEIWQAAQRGNLQEVCSPIQDASLHRALITHCDCLLLPEASGQPWSLTVECMAHGMPVIARTDPFLADILHGSAGVTLIESGTSDEWAEQLLGLLSRPEQARARGSTGRDHVAAHNRSSLQISRLAETLDRILHGGSYRLWKPSSTVSHG